RVLVELDRFADAKAVVADAIARGLDSSALHARGFDVAFVEGDVAAMDGHLNAVAQRPDRYLVLTEPPRAPLPHAALPRGRSLYSQAIIAARAAPVNEFAGSLYAELALDEALLGNIPDARAALRQALATGGAEDTVWSAALAAAMTKQGAEAAQLAATYQ